MSAVPTNIRVQAAAMRLLYGLPKPVRRLIAGAPIRLDGQQLALDAQLLLRMQKLARTGGLRSGTAEQSRVALDVAAELVRDQRDSTVHRRELTIPGTDSDLAATLYTPEGLAENSGLLVYFHGGGWVIGSRTSHDDLTGFLADRAQVRVLSVEYRLAPENPFPAAVDDALTAFDFAHAKASELGADPERIAVGGDSAGGNLAAVTSVQTARRGGPAPAFQLLLYPGVDLSRRRRSRELFSEGFYLTDADMNWFFEQYVPNDDDKFDPRYSPLLNEDFTGVPPAYIATAGFDPLRDEGEAYAERLRADGVPVALSRQSDLIHGFANMIGAGTRFREATAEAAGALRVGLSLPGSNR